ncbi:MAG: hypothetical protein WD032_10910 [Nitrospirales bacterium]
MDTEESKGNFRRRATWHIKPELLPSDKLIIFTACDSAYLDYAIPLIRSLEFFSPGFLFVLHVVNPSDLDIRRVTEFGRCLSNTRLAVSNETVKMLEGTSDEVMRNYYACARFMQLPDLLPELDLPVLCLDADSLFVNPIDFQFSEQSDADIVVFNQDLNRGAKEKWGVKNGSIWFRPSEIVQEFVSQVREELVSAFGKGFPSWYIDQIVVAQKLLEFQDKLVIGQIRTEYLDWDFRPSSVIWTAKGKRKSSENRYAFLMEMLSDRRSEQHPITSTGDPNESHKLLNRVAIFLPRLDLPWKLRAVDRSNTLPVLKEDTLNLRLYWKQFAVRLAHSLENHGIEVAVFEWPAWEIQPETVDRLGFQLAFIPHRCHLNFQKGKTKIFYFMQEYFRWVFVVDPNGWSAASTLYPFVLSGLQSERPGAFKIYRRWLGEGRLQTKFSQEDTASRESLVSSGQIPKGAYVFFPLQIPHDQSIQYFSDFSEEKIVLGILDWSSRAGVPVVFKPHPVNKKSMDPFFELVKEKNAFWSTANVQSLIEYSTGVFTINSGVGFEALLQLKPVVLFGRAEYDCVCFRASLESIPEAWKYCHEATPKNLLPRYQVFFDWFLSNYAFDLSQPKFSQPRFNALAEDVLTELSK